MSTVAEIEEAIRQISPKEREVVKKFLEELQEEEWDRQIEVDILSGKHDADINRAHDDLLAGKCRDLNDLIKDNA